MNAKAPLSHVAAASLAAGLLAVVAAPPASADPGEVTTLAGTAADGDLREMGIQPTGMTIDGQTMYVGDLRGTVRAVDLVSHQSSVVAGIGAWTGGAFNALSTETGYNSTYHLTRFGENQVVMQDQCGLVSVNVDTFAHERIAGTCDGDGSNSYGEDGTPALDIESMYVQDLLVEGNDVLYSSNFNLRRIDGETNLLSSITFYQEEEDQLPGIADGVALDDAYFTDIGSVAWFPNGDLLVAEESGHRLRVVDAGGDGLDGDDTVTTLAGDASQVYGNSWDGENEGGPAAEARLSSPGDVGVLSDGRVVFLDQGSRRVRMIDVDEDRTISTIGGSDSNVIYEDPEPVDATTIALNGSSLATAGDDKVYVASQNLGRLFELDLTAEPVTATIVGGDGSYGYFGDGGPATQAQLHDPRDLAIAPDGTVVVADTGNFRVRRIAGDGTIATAVGTGHYCSGSMCLFDDAQGTERDIERPNAVAVADDGTIYWAQQDGPAILAMDPDGEVRVVAGNGEGGAVDGDALMDPEDPWAEGTATLGYGIGGLELSPDGQSLFVADTGNDKVRRVELTGPDPQVTTVAGNGFSEFSGDGEVALDTQLSAHDIAFTPEGDLLVADGSNNRVRRIDADTQIVTTVMGTGIDPGELEDPSLLDLEDDGEVVDPLDANVFPAGIDVRADGSYAVASHTKVWLVDETGARRVFGHQTKQGYNVEEGPGVTVWAGGVEAVAFAADGSLLVADSYLNRIRKVDIRQSVSLDTADVVKQVYGRTAKLKVTLPSGATGDVEATVGSATVSAPVDAGEAILTLPALALLPGARTVEVSYDGVPGRFAPASKLVPVTVAKARPRVKVVATRSEVERGSEATFEVSVAAKGVTPRGTVTVRLAGTSKTVSLNAQGRAVVKVKVGGGVSVGAKQVTASYSGNNLVAKGKAKPARIRVTR